MVPADNIIQQYGGKLELEYNSMAYLHRYDFRTALFVPIDNGPSTRPIMMSAFRSMPSSTSYEEQEGGGESDSKIEYPFETDITNTVFYSAKDGLNIAKSQGRFISINANAVSELATRVALHASHLKWMGSDIDHDHESNLEEDKAAFYSSW